VKGPLAKKAPQPAGLLYNPVMMMMMMMMMNVFVFPLDGAPSE
jgi:hypothetical protein